MSHERDRTRDVMRRRGRLWPGTRVMRAARRAVLIGPLAAWLATGCIGLWRGDYYAGLSSGDLEACVPFHFDVSIEEGGRILGVAATEYRWGTVSWDVSGAVTGETSSSRHGPRTRALPSVVSGGGGVGTPYRWK